MITPTESGSFRLNSTVSPLMVTVPASSRINLQIARSSMVLPDPFGPTTP